MKTEKLVAAAGRIAILVGLVLLGAYTSLKSETLQESVLAGVCALLFVLGVWFLFSFARQPQARKPGLKYGTILLGANLFADYFFLKTSSLSFWESPFYFGFRLLNAPPDIIASALLRALGIPSVYDRDIPSEAVATFVVSLVTMGVWWLSVGFAAGWLRLKYHRKHPA